MADQHTWGEVLQKESGLLESFSCQVLKDAVLSHAPDSSNARKQSVAQAETVYNLLTIALTRRAQYGMLAEVREFQ